MQSQKKKKRNKGDGREICKTFILFMFVLSWIFIVLSLRCRFVHGIVYFTNCVFRLDCNFVHESANLYCVCGRAT